MPRRLSWTLAVHQRSTRIAARIRAVLNAFKKHGTLSFQERVFSDGSYVCFHIEATTERDAGVARAVLDACWPS